MVDERSTSADVRLEPHDSANETSASPSEAEAHASIPEGARCVSPALDAKGRGVICGKPATTTRPYDGIPNATFALCDDCAAAQDAIGGPPAASREPERLDWADPGAVATWLRNLRTAWDDAASVTEDMLKPERERNLGHAQHRRLFREAQGSIAHLLRHAERDTSRGV
jgi:hypothetical protein